MINSKRKILETILTILDETDYTNMLAKIKACYDKYREGYFASEKVDDMKQCINEARQVKTAEIMAEIQQQYKTKKETYFVEFLNELAVYLQVPIMRGGTKHNSSFTRSQRKSQRNFTRKDIFKSYDF